MPFNLVCSIKPGAHEPRRRSMHLSAIAIQITYSTAQLQGNVRTRFRRVSHAFWTRPSSSEKGAWHSRTSCCSFIARFCACMDASHVRPRRILHAFQTRSDVTLELSCTVITFELNWLLLCVYGFK